VGHNGSMRRRRKATAEADTPEAPCIPCGAQADVRQFALVDSSPPVADDDVPRRRDGIAETANDLGLLLVDQDADEKHQLNPTAAVIWISVDGKAPVSQIVEDLHRETGAPRDLIDPDVRATLSDLRRRGLLTITVASQLQDQ
jgi:hypothetical protein